MSCYHPLEGYQNQFTKKVMVIGAQFAEKRSFQQKKRLARVKSRFLRENFKRLLLPCSRCVGCRLEYGRQWALRGTHERKFHKRSCFVTLTYADKHLPKNKSLRKADYQKFLKRLRFAGYKFSYMFAGEYGERTARPHYHAIFFGEDFKRNSKYAPLKQRQGLQLWNSPALDKAWGKGHVVVGDCSTASIQYVASYITKKVNGKKRKDHYGDRTPEFMQVSLKNPIGKKWFEKHWPDVFPSDFIILDGKKVRPPRYYKKLLEKKDPKMFEQVQKTRQSFLEKQKEKTKEQLKAAKEITLARFRRYIKEIE